MIKTCRKCKSELAGMPHLVLGTAYTIKGSRLICLDCIPASVTAPTMFDWVVQYCREEVDPATRLKRENEELRAQVERLTTIANDLKKKNGSEERYK